MEAVISSVEADSLVVDSELKRQELNDAKLLVEDAKEQLKSEAFSHRCLLFICEARFIFPSDKIIFLRSF